MLKFFAIVLPVVVFASSVSGTAQTPAASGTTSTTITASPNPLSAGQNITVTATVKKISGSGTPTGSVQFSSDGVVLATEPVNGSGIAAFTASTNGYQAATYPVTGKYSGDANFSGSTSPAVNVTLNKAATGTTLSATPNPVNVPNSVTLKATVVRTASGSTGAPTGSVTFYYAGEPLGSAGLNASGVASLTESSNGIPANSYGVTAKYSGDTADNASTSSVVTVVVSTPPLAVSPSTATAGAGQKEQFSISPSGVAVAWQVNGVTGGSAATGTITTAGLYTAPVGASVQAVTITAVPSTQGYKPASASLNVAAAGQVSITNNGQVASYSIKVPATVSAVSVEFGQTTSYGKSTWKVTPSGGTATVLVAGMVGSSTYHMRADLTVSNGTATDEDHTFTTTTSLSPNQGISESASTQPNMTPQPGIEFVDNIYNGAFAYDLNGNLLWAYPDAGFPAGYQFQPTELLANGHVLLQVSPGSPDPLNGGTPAGAIYEVALDNTIIRSVTIQQLQTSLNTYAQANGYRDKYGNLPQLTDIHHEVTVNPTTGHWLIIANYIVTNSGVTGYPSNQPVLGDIVLDVNPGNNFSTGWIWNEFDHLDVNRHPYGFPDWTHSNAVTYSEDDGNILVSSRHQSWVMKVQYKDGTGDGTLLWRLGYQGDFKLVGGTEPQDWNNGQHQPSFTTTNTTGVFGLTLMDNGTYRMFNDGSQCLQQTITNLCYSRLPIFTVDETQMTATLSNPANAQLFAQWGGNGEQLANGNLEGDFCGIVPGSQVVEAIPGVTPQMVWSMSTPGTYQYRAHRIPSLYPGVQWTGKEDPAPSVTKK